MKYNSSEQLICVGIKSSLFITSICTLFLPLTKTRGMLMIYHYFLQNSTLYLYFYLIFLCKYWIKISYWNSMYYMAIVIFNVDFSHSYINIMAYIVWSNPGTLVKFEESYWRIWTNCLLKSVPFSSSATIFNMYLS